MKPKARLSEKSNKTDKSLARRVREKKEEKRKREKQRINFRNERGDITRNFIDRCIISEYYEL